MKCLQLDVKHTLIIQLLQYPVISATLSILAHMHGIVGVECFIYNLYEDKNEIFI